MLTLKSQLAPKFSLLVNPSIVGNPNKFNVKCCGGDSQPPINFDPENDSSLFDRNMFSLNDSVSSSLNLASNLYAIVDVPDTASAPETFSVLMLSHSI